MIPWLNFGKKSSPIKERIVNIKNIFFSLHLYVYCKCGKYKMFHVIKLHNIVNCNLRFLSFTCLSTKPSRFVP